MTEINSKIYLGLPSDTTPDEELENGGFEDGSGGASNYATGGSISYDGVYKIHTFTSSGDFVVSNLINADADILIVGGGGGGSSGGGGGGEVIKLTAQTLAAATYPVVVGAGGTGRASATADGDDGGDSTFNGSTANGGGGGGYCKLSPSSGDNGNPGGCGGGGGAHDAHITSGGTGDQGNGSGNSGYTTYPGRPAGGGGGAGGNAPGPAASDKGAKGGVGLADSITGASTYYGGGGGGGVYNYGFGGDGGNGGGGDGSAYGEGAAEAGTDGLGGGGGGGNTLNSGADGGNGVVIIRYTDAADWDFDDWTEVAGAGHVFAEEVIVYAGSKSCKLTGGAEIYQEESAGITAGNRMQLSFWSYGTITWEVYDNDNTEIIGSGSESGASWKQTIYAFEVPTGCTDIKVTFSGNDGYIDVVSLLDYGIAIWTLNEDVLADPAPRWSYGIMHNRPDDCVAGSGRASFVLDNPSGAYSPDHDSCTDGFEEGMPVKMTLSTDFDIVLGDWDQESFFEDGDLTELDASTPSWDKEVNAVADFDTEQDVDGDLNDHADAAHDGAVGLEITFDDANTAYGTMNADAVNQTSGVLSFWFNLNDVAIESSKYIIFAQTIDGVGSSGWRLYLYNNSGVYGFRMAYYDDAPVFHFAGTVTALESGYHKYTLMFSASTGAGNDDGWMRLYIDDALAKEDTGHDNDTHDWDFFRIGQTFSNSTTFGGSFYIDTIKLDPVGAPHADELAAINGSYGMSVPIMDTTTRYVSFTDPDEETQMTAEIMFDPNSITIGEGDYFLIGLGLGAEWAWYIGLGYASSSYYINAAIFDDVPAAIGTSAIPITDEPHRVRISWKASSSPGQDDGYLYLYIDDVLEATLSGVDNDTSEVSSMYFGAPSGVDAGTYGIIYFDDVRWMTTYYSAGHEFDKFVGYITKITPTSGQFDKPRTMVECVDWIGYLSHTEVGAQTIVASTTADVGLTTLLTEFENQPEATDFDTGDETFAYIFKSMPHTASMARAFYQLVWNENGRIFCKGDGTLRFENSTYRDSITTPAFELDGTMSGLEVVYDKNKILNIVTLTVSNTKVDAAATTVLWEVEEAISIPANDSLTLTFNYSDPDTGARVSAVDVVEPAGANLVTGANITVSGWAAGQDSAVATFTNSAGAAETVSTFNILGKGIYEYDTITITKTDADSRWKVGDQRFIRRLRLINAPATADTRAQAIIDKYAPSHIGKCRITVCANISNTLTEELILAEPSTRFTAIETATGISRDFFIDHLSYRQRDTLLWVTIEAQVV